MAQVNNYDVGDVVDDFTVTDVNGTTWNLYDITSQGKYVYLDFFFDTCVPCQVTQHVFNEVYDKYGCNGGDLFMISINNGTDTNAEVIAYEAEFGGSFNHSPAVGIEGGCETVNDNFGINGYPSYLLISPENVYLHRIDEFVQNITVETFEESFPSNFNPAPMSCSLNVEENEAFDFAIYPNPTHNNSTISLLLNRNISEGTVTIHTFLGQKVYTKTILQSTTVPITGLAAGTYIVRLETTGGMIIKKLVVN